MTQYLVILLDDTSTSFCNYTVTKTDRHLIPLDTLKAGILFAMKENLSVQFVYPDYIPPKEYLDVINTTEHFNIMPSSLARADADAIVVNDWNFKEDAVLQIPLIIRTSKEGFFNSYSTLAEALKRTTKIDLVITDTETFSKEDFIRYKSILLSLSKAIEQMYVEGLSPQLNVLTDRMMLKGMRNCGAGDTTITLAPNGKFYICPGFYYEDDSDCVGDVENGLHISNRQLYKIDYAPICRHCDAWQCKRCVWLNRKTTLEVNTPSHEQCVIAHLERNASRELLHSIREHGEFLPEFEDIKAIDYIDPFENRKTWK